MEFEPLLFFTCDRVGRNVAAGMTGGLAYILDEDNTLLPKVCAFSLQYFVELYAVGNMSTFSFSSLSFFPFCC